MQRLTKDFLDSCRRDGRRLLRGETMTRIETFVDAAFAFSFTMLVISIDQIPRSPAELLELSKDIPAFIISAIIIGSIWVAHTKWSRTFGLQDGVTVFLSISLVVLVLIFVYPIKLMIQASVIYMTGDVMNTGFFDDSGWTERGLVSLFVYFSVGLLALSAIIVSLYWNALRHKDELVLSDYELFYCKYSCVLWAVVGTTAVLSCLIALTVSASNVPFSGFIYFSMFVTIKSAQKLFLVWNPEPPVENNS